MEQTAITLETFLGYGTDLIEWLVQSALTLINTLMGNPVTAVFLVVGLVGLVFTTYRVIKGR